MANLSINRFYNVDNEREIIVELINLSKPNKEIPTIFIWTEGVLASTNLGDI